MIQVFLRVVNMSLSASVVIAAVLAVRVPLRAAPKKWSYLLWSAVGFRLACPVSLESAVSIFRAVPVKPAVAPVGHATALRYIPHTPEALPIAPPVVLNNGLPAPTPSYFRDAAGAVTPVPPAEPLSAALLAAAMIWVAGMAVLLLYTVFSYLELRRAVSDAVRGADGVWRSDRVGSPFFLGLLRPKIYVPSGLEGESLGYVLEHERCHLRRGDPVFKALAFALLTLHWFNPLCWLAFHLMGKDMELSCDEAVLQRNPRIRKAYSATLLSFAAGDTFPHPSPLAFGETAVKTRIKNALSWKQPKTWVTLLSAVAVFALVVSCAVNPAEERTDPTPGHLEAENLLEAADAEPVPAMMQVPIPEAYAGLVEVESTADRVTVYERKSREDFRSDFGKDPWPDYDHPDQVGMGWLCTLARVSEAEMLEMGVGDLSGVTFFGRDGTGYYVRLEPTDVRFYREGGVFDDTQGLTTWVELQEWAATLSDTYLSLHPEVEPYAKTNTQADIFLSRVACWDLEPTLADGAAGQRCFAGNAPHARDFSSRLALDYTFAWVDVDEARQLLTLPQIALTAGTPEENYWAVEFWPGENILQVVEGDMVFLFRATPRAGVTEPIGDVARAWYDEARGV